MRLVQCTPFVPCTRLDAQVDFYARLGFEATYRGEGYAFLRRGPAAIRLVEVFAEVDLHHPERQQSFYVDVEGIDALWEEVWPRLADLPGERVRAPFDQAYGQREFHVADEDCTLVFFGERIA